MDRQDRCDINIDRIDAEGMILLDRGTHLVPVWDSSHQISRHLYLSGTQQTKIVATEYHNRDERKRDAMLAESLTDGLGIENSYEVLAV